MFPMKDGSDFSWDNPIHRAHPFFTEDFEMTRDPRLYETLIVTGDKFWGRKAEIYKGGREQPKDMGGGQHWRWADMGYFGIGLRKYYQDHLNELQNKFYNCCLLRLPEIYLNIAEAMNELGKAEQKRRVRTRCIRLHQPAPRPRTDASRYQRNCCSRSSLA